MKTREAVVNKPVTKKLSMLDLKNMRYGTDFQTMAELEAFEASISKQLEYNLMDGVLGCVRV